MSDDYCDSSKRHWEDAEYLLADGRLANADHLFGISAECSLKAVMMALDSYGSYRVHIDKLWDEFITFANERSGARYSSRIIDLPNPFKDWNVNQRYQHRLGISRETTENHLRGAKLAKEILDAAILDGDLK